MSLSASAVVCCRRLVEQHSGMRTAAIGDGGNDQLPGKALQAVLMDRLVAVFVLCIWRLKIIEL